jgi:pimeloyl-ACP methyl ester carboxylesterase
VLSVDLQEGLDLARASHEDYAAVVVVAARRLPQPVALCGWSMGGLVVLQAADRVRPHSLVLIEASPPGQVQGFSPDVELQEGVFDPRAVYGRFPTGIWARPESLLARGERKRGLSIPSLPCRSLVVYGDDYREERGRGIAELYGSEELNFPGISHWGLVRDPRIREGIARFLGLSC